MYKQVFLDESSGILKYQTKAIQVLYRLTIKMQVHVVLNNDRISIMNSTKRKKKNLTHQQNTR